MSNYCEMIDSLEKAAVDMHEVHALLSVTVEEVFSKSNLILPYYGYFETLLCIAIDKVTTQEKVMDELVKELFISHKGLKGE